MVACQNGSIQALSQRLEQQSIQNQFMAKLIKHTLRQIFKTKRQNLVNQNQDNLKIGLQNNLQKLYNKILLTTQSPINMIGSYIPDRLREIQPPLIEGIPLAYPRFQAKKKEEKTPPMQFKAIGRGQNVDQQLFGIKMPSKRLATVYPNIILVPLICFHPVSLHRIGYGGGYYDSYIEHTRSSNTSILFIGIGAECLKTQQEFWSKDDQPLDFIITQDHIY